ncbi:MULTISPECIES: cobaltochelatase subunit CobN [Methanothrix]|jgi:cobaltochelatase CobN|uniref:cobaltochelatase subunit CobN n=2 Tax=Methanotrichaceae TaxID=143067 RepID=UPI000AD4EC65|nr:MULTISPECIES: cobaltochelatase subunit CobN [Methanothrix]MDD3551302.1 cobaltochelatase subunit CobN [Methanothrix soehngenii]MDY0410752.1 cobaltochelatase subunit CobN [Methanothrix soehngenii]HOE46306.1 cobaltochelatase subunit CobN [Methanothrix soehngenii]HOI20518.1 cobaltochelatase subunit CobN [Methanothrix soehngenii]HOS23091.1 cobaltochelatase subunit CobN [Methanothrix soehngenii]
MFRYANEITGWIITKKVKIAYVTTQEASDVFPLISALKELIRQHGEVAEVAVRSGEDLKDVDQWEEFEHFARSCHIAIFNLHGGKKSLSSFDELVQSLQDSSVSIYAQSASNEPEIELMKLSTVDDAIYRKVSQYLDYGGRKNFYSLILYLANYFIGSNYEFSEPARPIWEGIYHPDFDHVPTLKEYLQSKCVAGRPTVGLWFYQSLWQAGNTLFIDRLIEEIERQGANVIPVFLHAAKDVERGTKGAEWVVENLFMKDGRPIIDVLISTLMFSLSIKPWEGSDTGEGQEVARSEEWFIKRLNVPVLKAIVTYNTLADWNESLQGCSPMDISMGIAMPEFDGMLITVPVAARERTDIDPLTGARVIRFEPLPERTNKIVRLSLNWAKLRHIPNSQKKVAIIFHNYPPRDDRIGTAFGLDSPVSVLNIMKAMDDAGYTIERMPENGQALIEDVKSRLTLDRRWRSPEELAKRAIDSVTEGDYKDWFEQLPVAVQEKMTSAWGEAPGKLFVHKKNLIIPGVINGNIFIGLQPSRGFLEDPAAIYHSPDHPIPHHYYAYYRWIRDVFRADLVMHIGKHGSLEWLPGKSVGLSDSCFPDIAISDLPNIYPYIINNPGEGTQAKRRSYCCIIDHLVPVMHNADAYDEMAELEVMLADYYQAASEDQSKLPTQKKMIWEKVCEAKLDHDLEVEEEEAFSDFDKFLEKLHEYLHEMADTQIRDGLHILGEPPEGSRLDEFLVALTRLANGQVPSLRQSLAEAMGYDYDYLLDNRGKIVSGSKTCGQVIDDLNSLALRLVSGLHEQGFAVGTIPELVEEILGKRNPKIEKVLDYIATTLAPNIDATVDELSAILCASDGGFVSPGPSGAPTRGMADILPTGRNFYSVDPQAIPSQAAWKVGVAQADALLERYLEDEGCYPESLGMVIWGSPTMRTKGDDIAEVLCLMGVRPVWEERSGRVTGIELIPIEELQRPRIDVMLRISGFFRDAFPNIVHLVDRAVELVAEQKEPPEQNFLAKHVSADISEKTAAGIDGEQAKTLACYRIFGCRPGAYGAGVSDAIDSKNWKDEKDLAEIYVKWGGYAYGRKNFGATVPDEFRRRLSRLDLTVKNEDTREYDMLDGDDFYSYHGGMIAAVKALKGELPRSYCGDSSDPDRVKTRSTVEETKHIFRARILNPKWIESMKRHGYKGAGDISRMVDIAFGWDATAEVLEDWMYEELANKYALDKDMQEWLKKVNPHALQNIAERLLEAVERGMWQATEEMKEELRDVYLDIEGWIEDDQPQTDASSGS